MKNTQSDSTKLDILKYREEHISCKNYIADQSAVIQIYEEKAYRAITKSVTEKTTLIFVLKGVLHFTFADAEPKISKADKCSYYRAAMNFTE